jgi:hypothetical protein
MKIELNITQADFDLAGRTTKNVAEHLAIMVKSWAERARQANPGLSDDEIIKTIPTVAEQEARREAEHLAIAEQHRLERLFKKEQEDEATEKRAAEQAVLDAKAKEQRDADVAVQAQAIASAAVAAALGALPAHIQAELAKGAAPAADPADMRKV